MVADEEGDMAGWCRCIKKIKDLVRVMRLLAEGEVESSFLFALQGHIHCRFVFISVFVFSLVCFVSPFVPLTCSLLLCISYISSSGSAIIFLDPDSILISDPDSDLDCLWKIQVNCRSSYIAKKQILSKNLYIFGSGLFR